jgi:hypothetical protein
LADSKLLIDSVIVIDTAESQAMHFYDGSAFSFRIVNPFQPLF